MATPTGWTVRWDTVNGDWAIGDGRDWADIDHYPDLTQKHNSTLTALTNDALGDWLNGTAITYVANYSAYSTNGIAIRVNGSYPAVGTGYYIYLAADDKVRIDRLATTGRTNVASTAFTTEKGIYYGLKVQAVEGTITVWAWRQGQAPPGSATLTYTDADPILDPGGWGLGRSMAYLNNWASDWQTFTFIGPTAFSETEPPVAPSPPAQAYCYETYWDLTIFQDDDVTPLLGTVDDLGQPVIPTCASLGTFERPWLDAVPDGAAAELDLLQATGTIGQLDLTIFDKQTNPCEQGSGWLTDLMRMEGGRSSLLGRRALVRRIEADLIFTVMDGVMTGVRLEDYTTFRLSIKDIRERERNVRLFNRNETYSLWPPGPADGYGYLGNFIFNSAIYLIDPADTGAGTFHSSGSYIEVTIDPIPHAVFLAGYPKPVMDADGFDTMRWTDITVRWRPVGGAWTYLRNMEATTGADANMFIFGGTHHGVMIKGSGYIAPLYVTGVRLGTPEDGASLPSDGQTVEFQILAVDTSEDTPFYLEGNAGTVLQAIYDGTYSDFDPGIRYDPTYMQAFVDRGLYIRFVLTEPQDDLREWVRTNIYQPLGYAPALTADGLIAPISWAYPDADETLILLHEDIAEPPGEWQHTDANSVTAVEFTYIREYLAAAQVTDEYGNTSTVNQLQELPITIRSINATTQALLGEKSISYKPVTIRSVGAYGTGISLLPDTLNEFGLILARLRAQEVFDRFTFGAPLFTVNADRRDPDIRDATVGRWVNCRLSWVPDYIYGARGSERLMQIIGIRDTAYNLRELSLVDAFANADPLDPPTIDSVTANADGTVDIAVSGIPDGAQARVDYAVSTTLPDDTAGSWNYVTRLDAPSGTATTPPQPAAIAVWARARSVRVGYRPSAWVHSGTSTTTPSTPRLLSVSLAVDNDTGGATLTWIENAATLGVRIRYGTALLTQPATMANDFDMDATAETYTFADGTVAEDYVLWVGITPYPGFSGGAVTGLPGDEVIVQGYRTPGGTPSLSSVAATRTASGDCSTGAALAHTVTWSVSNYAGGYGIRIQRKQDSGAYLTVAEHVGPLAGSQVVYLPGYIHDAINGTAVTHTFHVSLVRTVDGVSIASGTSSAVSSSILECAEPGMFGGMAYGEGTYG